MSKPAPTPRYTHDCTACRFLGTVADCDMKGETHWVDLYVHDNEGHLGSTVLARYGDEGSEYTSSPAKFIDDPRRVHDNLNVAKLLAGL